MGCLLSSIGSPLRFLLVAALASSILCGCRKNAANAATTGDSASSVVTIWTNSSATTPLLPLLAALPEEERLLQGWNTTVAFQSLLLGGQGEFWVGHLEGFARAYRRGAPLKLLAVTGWRKWQLLSKREMRFPEDFRGKELPFGPADGAGRYLLEALLKDAGEDTIRIAPLDVKPLMLRALQGQAEFLMLPEPFATSLCKKDPSFHRITSLEEIYGAIRHRAPEVPWAGIAVNDTWAQENPQRVQELLERMSQWSPASPEEVCALWTPQQEAFSHITQAELRDSLTQDPVKCVPAKKMIGEIREFLGIVAPELPFDENILWQ